ncbi:MAG: hypothetical protein J0G95_10830 [Rhizobiales bacterium]|nr:hypothetical protein [Hyphomicrobiales bacterium]
MRGFGTTGGEGFRGGITVGNTFYGVWIDKVFSFDADGGAGAQLTGVPVPGTAPVICARNNAAVPDVVIVAPGDGAVILSAGAVASYPDPDVGQPNAVCFLKGFFVFTYGDGKTRTSGINSTSINTLDVATAESKPDALYRPIPLGNGQLTLWGSASGEVWGGQNDTAYPFSYIATINRGIVGPYAIAGHDDGFGKGIFAVTDDFKVSTLDGYTPVPVSPTELDILIENEPDKTQISVSVYVAQGHGFVVVKGASWCWEYDTTLKTWHERQSHLQTGWRGMFPVKAFDKWLCGDTLSGNLLEITGQVHDEVGDPLRMRIETGPFGSFPQAARINTIELYLTKGAGIATGTDPVQTDPDVEISISRDGGNKWSNPRSVKIGRQAITAGRVRSSIWGQADVQGVRWRFDESSNVPFGFMGVDMQAEVLR